MRWLLIPTLLFSLGVGLWQDSPYSIEVPKRLRIAGSFAQQMIQKKVSPPEVGVKGDVVLKVLVGEDGKVLSVRSISGDKRLIEAAIPAVLRWEFAPYFLNGKPIQFVTNLTIRFKGTNP